MAKGTKKKAATKTGKRLSYKDVQIAYLADGVSAVEKLLNDGRTSRAAIRKALDALRQQGAAAATLDDFVKTHLGQGGRRGRTYLALRGVRPGAVRDRQQRPRLRMPPLPRRRRVQRIRDAAAGGGISVGG